MTRIRYCRSETGKWTHHFWDSVTGLVEDIPLLEEGHIPEEVCPLHNVYEKNRRRKNREV